jgi:hypothetical protein
MYLFESPDPSKTVFEYARQYFDWLKTLVAGAQAFWTYVKRTWLPKLPMWVMGNRHIPYTGQDANVEIESYHLNMKATLKASRSCLVGRRVDWLIHELTHDIIKKYEYNHYLKENGFVSNKKAQRMVINSVMQANNKILDLCVSLPSEGVGPAYVTFAKRGHIKYAVYNPDTEWACCKCVHA